ncbi:MAG: hypothetical protein V4487_03365 [Chlamydiota bacterium]
MSMERPGGLPPIDRRSSPLDTKAAREERQKVEKVREIDPDEETQRRKRKFEALMGDDKDIADDKKSLRAPSPFETEFYSADVHSSLGDDVKNAIVPSPSYSPPPDVSQTPVQDEDVPGDLPRSGDFWEHSNLPSDQPIPPQQFQEKSLSPQTPGKPQKGSKKESEASPFGLPGKSTSKKTSQETAPSGKKTPPDTKEEKAFSPFGSPPKKETKPPSIEKKKEGSPFTPPMPQGTSFNQKQPSKSEPDEEKGPSARYLNREEEALSGEPAPPFGTHPRKEKKTPPSFQKKEEDNFPLPTIAREQERDSGSSDKKGQGKIEGIAASLPPMPREIQPIVQTATVQALSYLSPETVPLFFQMVGSMYIMIIPPGISRTELLLNQPLYAGSKFFNARITIEKYATAPDSFNIRLTGPDAAVATFKENIPSLMTAFQNGNFPFRVNRVDAEYTVEKPHFRRRERDEGKGDFGGDLGDRRK